MAQMLDLDADVLRDFHQEVITTAGSLVPARARVVDLGAGSGTGTLALARHLPDAEVTAVDVDEDMLGHLQRQAADAGLGERVHTVRADLDGDWPDLGPADLVWASASMHHFADPGRTLGQVHGVLRPGGVVTIVEQNSFPRFLGDDLAASALEDRCHAVMAGLRQAHGMHMGEDWGSRLKSAGFEVAAERRFDIELRAPLPANAGRYAQLCLGRMRHGLAEHLRADDLAALDELTATVADRADLTVRATRMLWVGRRP